jgi:hypothetical protein
MVPPARQIFFSFFREKGNFSARLRAQSRGWAGRLDFSGIFHKAGSRETKLLKHLTFWQNTNFFAGGAGPYPKWLLKNPKVKS